MATVAWHEAAELLRRDAAGGAAQDQPTEALLLRAHVALHTGSRTFAEPLLAALRAAIEATSVPSPTWWQRRDLAELRLVLGLHLRGAARGEEAAAALTAAVADFTAGEVQPRDVLGQQRLTRARVELAALVLAGFGAAAEVAPLLGAAESWYRGAGPAYRWRLADIERMRGRTPR